MSLENKEQLEKEMREKVMSELGNDHALAELLLTTLDNFSYRYFESQTTGKVEARIEEGRHFVARATETNVMESLKAQNKTTKAELIKLAKEAGKSGIAVQYEIGIKILDNNSKGGGIYHLQAIVSCQNFKNSNNSTCDYEDVMELRNKLAKDLEDICTVF